MANKILKPLLPLLLLAGSSAIAVLLFINRPENVVEPAELRPTLVDVAEVYLQDLRIPIQAQGTVSPHRETALVSEVGGKIMEVSHAFNVGGYVAEGDVLVRIDGRDYQANLLQAKAEVESAESELAQEKGRAEVAYKEWQKLPNKGKRSPAATELYLRKPQLELAQARLLSNQARLSKAQDDLDRTLIRAPYDALIKAKHVDLGQYVTPGTALAGVFSVDYAEIRLAIPQTRLSYLDLPAISGYSPEDAPLVDLYTDLAGDITHWTGRLVRTEGVVDERSRVLYTVARVDDPYALAVGDSKPLRVGTFVKANIVGKLTRDLAVLPRYVLRAGNLVWVVDDQLTLRNRSVTTLRTEGEEIYVSGGLQAGDLVSLTTVAGAIPGMRVRINTRTSTLPQQDPVLEAASAPAGPSATDPGESHGDENTPDQSSTAQDALASEAA